MSAQAHVEQDQRARTSAGAAPGHALAPVAARVWQAWADAIVLYWEELLAGGALDLDAPLCVLDFGAADAMLAAILPTALARRLAASPCAAASVHYLTCAGEAQLLEASLTLNPMVCVGWHRLAHLACSHHAVHYGALYATPDGQAWEPCVAPDPGLAGLLAYYMERCPSAQLDLPVEAMALARHYAGLARGRYLFIGADAGPCTLQQLRLQSCAAGLPAIHAWLLACAAQGASTWCLQYDDQGCAVHLVRGDGAAPGALAEALAAGHPDDAAVLATLARAAAPDQVLGLLRTSGHDPALLAAAMATLLAAPEGVGGPPWQDALARTWSHYRMPAAPDPFYRQLAVLGARVRHWGLAKDCLQAGLACYGHDAQAARLLAQCEAASTGRGHGGDELVLAPLRRCHAAALWQQYRDPSIAAMACLPPLATPAAAARWIAAQRKAAGKRNYAVMHACWGLVGLVGLHHSGDAGYFYFWTGSDFQDAGIGRAAATLAFARAQAQGCRHVYTSVYADNARSLRALAALGFMPLAVRALPPHADMLLLHTSLDGGAAPPGRLQALCTAIGNPIQFQQEQEAETMTVQT
ncbi:MAG: GNAT family protein [Pseudomonadota bacterium]